MVVGRMRAESVDGNAKIFDAWIVWDDVGLGLDSTWGY